MIGRTSIESRNGTQRSMIPRRFNPPDSNDAIAAAVNDDGGAIIDHLVPEELIDRLQSAVEPWLAASPSAQATRQESGLAGSVPSSPARRPHES